MNDDSEREPVPPALCAAPSSGPAGHLLPAGEKRERGVSHPQNRETSIFAERVIAAAEGWIGTPYRHQASLKGVGCDCLGLVRGVWRELYGAEPELPPAFQPDWAERSGQDRLRDAALRHFGPEHCVTAMRPGDLLLFCWRPGLPAKHAGILSSSDRFIHAYEQAAVISSALVPSWRRRIAGVFRFPEKV